MARQVKVLIFHAKRYDAHEVEKIVKDANFEVKEIEDMPHAFANAISCQYIDIVKRSIGNKTYNIIHEDDGYGMDDFVISLLAPHNQVENVFGTVIIAGLEDAYGELTDLSDDDMRKIISRVGYVTNTVRGKEIFAPVIVLD